MISSNPRANRTPTIEEQRAAIQVQLALRPGDQYLKQALTRLTSPQHIKAAARSGVFISYSGSDELFAVQLAEDLRATGLSVWLDMIDISDDGDWQTEVNAALSRCGLMVTILSPHALLDKDMLAENDYFMKHGKIIVPVVRENCKLEAITFWDRPVDFRHDYALGLTILVRLLASQTSVLSQ